MKLENLINDRISKGNTRVRREIDASCCNTKRDWGAFYKAEEEQDIAQNVLDEHLAQLANLWALINEYTRKYANVNALGHEVTPGAQKELDDARTAMNVVLEIIE
jgi:hypothetical protein